MNTTIKNIVISTSVCCALLLSSVTFAQSGNEEEVINKHEKKRGLKHGEMGKEKLEKLIKHLELSESQVIQIKEMKSQERAQLEALKPQMKVFREQVSTLMAAETFDEQAFVALQLSNQEVYSAMALIKAKSKFAMKSVLNEEQRKKFMKVMKNKLSR